MEKPYELARSLSQDKSIFRKLGVNPIINCGGVRSTFGGSNPTPRVVAAMEAAAKEFVNIDELAEAIGPKLGSLAHAEWGIITSCTTAAMALATAASIAGHAPDRMLELPSPSGPHKVAIPTNHRFAYDFVFRTVGANIVTFNSLEELSVLLDGSVVLICLLGRADSNSPPSMTEIISLANKKRVPVMVDAAAQAPTRPDKWIAMGADLVVYAGGKFVRGPQSTGFLIGKEKLCRMAWLNGPPHQAFGRAMKIGKEEIVGAFIALEDFLINPTSLTDQDVMKRRLDAIDHIITTVPHILTEFIPSSPAWLPPRLRISWDTDRYECTGDDVRLAMDSNDPRIHIHDFWATSTSIVIDPFNLDDGQDFIVGTALKRYFQDFRKQAGVIQFRPVTIPDSLEIEVEFFHGTEKHHLALTQASDEITGFHNTGRSRGTVTGKTQDDHFVLVAKHEAVPAAIYYTFKGKFEENFIAGHVQIGAATPEHYGPVFNSQFGTVRWQSV